MPKSRIRVRNSTLTILDCFAVIGVLKSANDSLLQTPIAINPVILSELDPTSDC